MHPTKRRKLDQPQLFQNKPFRSPLRSVAQQQAPASIAQPAKLADDATKPEFAPSLSATTTQKIPNDPVPSDYSNLASPEDLQRQLTTLSIRLTQLRQSLESAEQALEIEASGQDAEVEKLITKWRSIAQEAADELFVGAKERVDGMGGVVAWRHRVQEDSQSWTDASEKENMAQQNTSDPEELKADEDGRIIDEQEESEADQDDEESVSQGLLLSSPVRTNVAFLQSFTMEMMLHSMHIDLQAIGFDKQLERWVE